jgi:diguanylate cyclase (GGDEF)-like protein
MTDARVFGPGVNSGFGYDVGNELLRIVAGRLRHSVRNADTIARWGGDEFAALLDTMSRPEDAPFVAQRILYALSRPFVREGQDFYLTASVGIALHPADGTDVSTLLQHADAAMYRVKRLGGNNYYVYSAQMNLHLSDRLAMAHRLRGAVKREEFVLHYQPQLDIRDGTVVGLEALLRWNDSARGQRSPAEFIPVLEETGLIIPVGEWVLRKACTQARAWQFAGLTHLRISVNLSPKQFREKELPRKVESILKETGLEPGSLELELTESVLMDDQKHSASVLDELKDLGALIALDDFGIGYSSLGLLKAFPVDTLKIDRSFIRDIGEDEEDRAICSAIVNLGQALKLQVMAEGVETEAQMGILRECGCHLIQGFLFARPMPPDDVWTWLTTGPPVAQAR